MDETFCTAVISLSLDSKRKLQELGDDSKLLELMINQAHETMRLIKDLQKLRTQNG